jgi:glucosamine--fructose-6-phosphate aminotransferase (isomerizing)
MAMSILEREIFEQPRVFQRLLDKETQRASDITGKLKGRFDYVFIAARGTSDNAARYAQYLFGAKNRIPVALATPSLFSIYQSPPIMNRALVIGISQSGQSPDIIEVILEGNRQGQPTLAITNDLDSPMAKEADYAIHIHAGDERAIAATKTYTTSLGAMALLSSLLADDTDRIEKLGQVPALMEQTLESTKPLLARVERYLYMEQCSIIGRGYNYSTCFEIALKIKELNRIVAEPYSSADFRHGPIATAGEGFPVMVIVPSSEVSADLGSLLADLQELACELMVISDDPKMLAFAHFPMALPPGTPEWISPLIAVIPGQLFSMALACAKGLDPDQPAGLSKVTLTR